MSKTFNLLYLADPKRSVTTTTGAHCEGKFNSKSTTNTQTDPNPHLRQEILLATHDPITGNLASLESLAAELSTDTSSNTTSPPSTPQTPNMSGITTAPAVHVSITRMPTQGHSMAPHFDGNALNLHLYFDEVESLSIDAGLNEEGKV
jgi:hypothetical protein